VTVGYNQLRSFSRLYCEQEYTLHKMHVCSRFTIANNVTDLQLQSFHFVAETTSIVRVLKPYEH